MSVLVLGVGNILLKDEGIGVRVVQTLEQRYELGPEVEVVDGGTCGMDLLDTIANREHVIIVDAVRTGDAPGTMVRLRGDQVPAFFRTKISPHQLGLSDLLAMTELTGEQPGNLVLIGAVPFDMGTGLELSENMARRVEPMLALTIGELDALGHGPTPLPRTGTDG